MKYLTGIIINFENSEKFSNVRNTERKDQKS